MPLPAPDLRANRGTWAVPTDVLPAVANVLHDLLPNEPFDPNFRGQRLETTYFDDAAYSLRKARRTKARYLTLRVRCYQAVDGSEAYALSAKTEAEKFRVQLAGSQADALLAGGDPAALLPAHRRARLNEIGAGPLLPVVTVCCRRYAVEDDTDRYTLDVDVDTDRGKHLGFGVLEFKSTRDDAPPGRLVRLGLRPLKLSKFLWATGV